MKKQCLNCRIDFVKPSTCSQRDWPRKKYCSKECYALSLRFKYKGEGNPFYGKEHVPETKKKIAKSLLGKVGEQARNWKGGVEKNREYKRAKLREWYKSNPERAKRIQQRRLALHKKNGDLPLERIQKVYEDNIKYFGTLTCIYCLEPIKFGNDALEHIIPLNKDGDHSVGNLGIACKSCNCSKQGRTPGEWISYFK